MLLTYFLNDFEIVPAALLITDITFGFTFHMRCISVVRSVYSYFRIFSASFLITFLSPENATSIKIHVPFSWSRIIKSGLLLGLFSQCVLVYIIIIIIIIIHWTVAGNIALPNFVLFFFILL